MCEIGCSRPKAFAAPRFLNSASGSIGLPESCGQHGANQRCDIDSVLGAVNFQLSVKLLLEIHGNPHRLN
jgi:hypothetical protein